MTIHFKPFSHFIVIVGMKAAGKTKYTIFLCKSLDRLLFIDPTWQVGMLGYVVHYPEKIAPAFKRYAKVIYQPMKMTEADYQKVFEVCLTFSNYTLGVDEIDKFASPRWYICEAVKEIINRGRAQGIGLICNTRRPHMIHNDIRSNADFVVCFKLHEERDRKYMGEWLGLDPLKIKMTPPYHSYVLDVEHMTTSLQLPLDLSRL